MANPDHNRPHVIGHLFGVTGFGRERREARARREEESHASIAYEEKSEPVTELPASVVYGKKKGFFGR
jgi:hypothetical protein